MSKPDFIVQILKLICEGKCIVVIYAFSIAIVVEQHFVVVTLVIELRICVPWYIVLVVFDVFTRPVPTLLHFCGAKPAFLKFAPGEYDWFHTQLVE